MAIASPGARAAEMALHSGIAPRFYKRLLRISECSDLAVSLETTAALQAIVHRAPEHAASVEAFLAVRGRHPAATP